MPSPPRNAGSSRDTLGQSAHAVCARELVRGRHREAPRSFPDATAQARSLRGQGGGARLSPIDGHPGSLSQHGGGTPSRRGGRHRSGFDLPRESRTSVIAARSEVSSGGNVETAQVFGVHNTTMRDDDTVSWAGSRSKHGPKESRGRDPDNHSVTAPKL